MDKNFKIIKKLGEGAFSKVYKVQRIMDNQIYALKKVQITNLSEKQKCNSLNEIRVLASINNKYIVKYKEAFLDEKDSTLCLVMEFADNGDLSKLIEEQKKSGTFFKEKDIWKIFIQLVKGLKSLHDLNIIHRDIKSSNIFLFSDGTAKLGDLNVCKIISENNLGKTQAGTPSFAAPEVWTEKPYGLKSDIWSLGCVLYEMVTLKCPFRSNNLMELYNKILIGEFNKIPDIFSPELNCMIQLMIKFEPDKRISCDIILEYYSILQKRRNSKGKSNLNDERDLEDYDDNIINNEEKPNLLETIYMPNNLLYLNNQLPKSNYSQEIKYDYRRNKTLKPIKLKSDLQMLNPNQNYNKYNSDGKLPNLSNNIMNSQNSKISTNLSILFNKDLSKSKKSLNINPISKSMKGPIKLKRINKNFSPQNEINKNKESSSQKTIHNTININDLPSMEQKNLKNIEEKLKEKEEKEKIDFKSIQPIEKEIKFHHFIDHGKFNEILYNKKKRKKSHSYKKEYNFKLKLKSKDMNTEINLLNNRYDNENNEYKQIPTEVNISENKKDHNKLGLRSLKLSHDVNIRIKNASNKCINKYNFNNKNEFMTNFVKKNNIDSILPVLKPSCKRFFEE